MSKTSKSPLLAPEYRPDIDGLRAIAVLGVVFFHFFPEWMAGGFLGVDIFFVISGYLISGSIFESLESGTLNWAEFYARRIRRIFPALILVLIACYLFGWFFLLADEFKILGKEIASGAAFITNFMLLKDSGYFDASAESKPLLHLWSLGVEEQFYLIWPLILWISWKLRGWSFLPILLIAAASFYVNIKIVEENPIEAFYLPQTRFWELLSGSILAWTKIYILNKPSPYPVKFLIQPIIKWLDKKCYLMSLSSILGILIIFYAFTKINNYSSHPVKWTILTVLGTVLIIAAGRKAWLNKALLSQKLIVGIGLISFPLYLWHWPILTFARVLDGESPNLKIRIGLLLFSFALSWITYVVIERNIRKITTTSIIFIVLLPLCILVGGFGYASYAQNGFPQRAINIEFLKFKTIFKWSRFGEKRNAEGDVCVQRPSMEYPGLMTCEFGDVRSNRILVLYGDSHGEALSRVLSEKMYSEGIKVIKVNIGCRIIPYIVESIGVSDYKSYYESCDEKFTQLKRFIKDKNASTLLISRWTFNFYPIKDLINELPFDNHVGGVEKDLSPREFVVISANGEISYDAAPKRYAAIKVISELAAASQFLYVNYPIPEIGWDIYKYNLSHFFWRHSILNELSYPYTRYLDRNKFIIDILSNDIQNISNVIFLRPDIIFCQKIKYGLCFAQHDGVPYYLDDDHVSDQGAKLVLDELGKYLEFRH